MTEPTHHRRSGQCTKPTSGSHQTERNRAVEDLTGIDRDDQRIDRTDHQVHRREEQDQGKQDRLEAHETKPGGDLLQIAARFASTVSNRIRHEREHQHR